MSGRSLILSLFVVALLTSFVHAGDRPPNIVFILADDLGWTDLGCQGSKYYETPNIDRLAREGMRLTCYHNCQNCAPTRAALMSGQYPPRTGMYTVGTLERGRAEDRKMNVPVNETNLPLDRKTLADMLKEAGYVTGMFGKWHLGQMGPYHPSQRGFDEAIVSMGKHFDFATSPKAKVPPGTYLADWLTDQAVQFIDRHKDRPFFLYLPHFGVHSPYQAKKELVERFKKKAGVDGHHDPVYAAMIASIDESVGRVLAKLEELKILDNTVVIFSSDNGGVGGYQEIGGKGVTSNRPLRGGKGMLYAGGVRVPFLIRWSGHTRPGSTCPVPTIHVDLFPTFLEIAGAKKRPPQVLDGESLVPLFKDSAAKLKRDAIYAHFPGYLEGYGTGNWRTTPVGSIQSGDWKLMEFFETGKLELYNLADDLGEKNNLADQMPAKTKELHSKLIAWRQEVKAPMPQLKKNQEEEACVSRSAEAQETLLASQQAKLDFAHDIAPLLKTHCAECHTNGKYKGSLNMDTREDLLKSKVALPGKSAASEFFKRITSADPELRMPPKGAPLSPKEIALFKTWIDQGLSWEPGFTFKTSTYAAPLKLRRPKLPAAQSGRDHPIDRLVDAYYAQRKVQPPADADEVTFVRRIHLDLTGLLPTPAEVEGFLKESAPDKRTKLVQRLLADPRTFADHWLSFWNDMLRNDYAGTGYIDGGRKQITPWLYQALLTNKPYDQFVRELINPTADAEGFIKGIKWRGNVNASQVPELQFSQNVSQVFFGVNMKCASCHDSFIDNWKLEEAYALAAVIADKPLVIHRCDKPLDKTASPRFLWPELGTIDAKASKQQRLEQLSKLVTHPDNGRFSRTMVNRLWQRLLGRGLVHPVDIMANRPWNEDLLDYLANYLVDQRYDLKKVLEHIVTSRAYQAQANILAKEITSDDYVFHGPEVRRMTAEQFLDTLWQITGAGPKKADAPMPLPAFAEHVPPERRLIRAALVKSDALMRSLGRPNREQVVTTRPDVLTTLQALDLSNGQILTNYLTQGGTYLLKSKTTGNVDHLAERVYLLALCRPPTLEELTAARTLLGPTPTEDTISDLLWCMIMLPEYQLIR